MTAGRWPAVLVCTLGVLTLPRTHLSAQAPGCAGVNVLTPAEKADGWTLLFDGTTTTSWHGYNKQDLAAWAIEDCALKTVGVLVQEPEDQAAG